MRCNEKQVRVDVVLTLPQIMLSTIKRVNVDLTLPKIMISIKKKSSKNAVFKLTLIHTYNDSYINKHK